MPPQRTQRKFIAKKSAPSHYTPTPPRSDQNRSSSPMSLDDQVKYIDKWGVNQFESCRECGESGLGTRCFVAERVSPRCGNCLRVGKQCHFSQTIDSDDDEDEDENVDLVMISPGAVAKDDHVTKRRKGDNNIFQPIVAENLLNYDPEDDEPQILSPRSSPKVASTNSRTRNPQIRPPNMHLESPRKTQFHPSGLLPTRKPATPAAPSKTAPRQATRPGTTPLAMRSGSPPSPTRVGTPPLAMDKPSFDLPYAPTSSYQEPLVVGPGDLSFAEKNSIIVAMQKQMDWNDVAAESGVDVDRAMKWWMRVSSELVRR